MTNSASRFSGNGLFNNAPVSSSTIPWYTGAEENPSLRLFVETHQNALSPLSPTTLPLSQVVSRSGALYEVHSYWSKKPYHAIERFISHYTRPGELVFDPFCGCGSTLQAALGMGRRAIGCDLSPSATHIAANVTSYADEELFYRELAKFISLVTPLVAPFYSCRYKGTNWIVASIVHSETAKCIKCLKVFTIIEPHSTSARECCPHCREPFSTRSKKVQFGPSEIVAVDLRESWKSKRGQFVWLDETPLEKLFSTSHEVVHREAERIRATLTNHVPQRLLDLGGRLSTTGCTSLGRLHEDRSLCALQKIADALESVKDVGIQGKLRLMFTSILTNCSRLYRFREGGGGGAIGAYYIPPIRRELNPLYALIDKGSTISSSLREIAEREMHDFIVSTQSSARLDMPSCSIDFVFTDPPYADTMPFGDLNFIWDSWLGASSSSDKEAIGDAWRPQMLSIFREVYRVLKPGAFCAVCYHDTSEGTWADLLDIMAEAGFRSVFGKDVLYIETTQKAYQQTVADKVVKRDHVVVFQKPTEPLADVGEVSGRIGNKRDDTFNEVLCGIIRDFLVESPGATKDRIYDYTIGRLMKVDRLEPHKFEGILRSVAEEIQEDTSSIKNKGGQVTSIQSRWYLMETADHLDHGETAKEDSAARLLKTFVKKYLEKHPEEEGVHFGELFGQYLAVSDKTRRLLADWLPEYFIKTPSGTWRLPDKSEDEQLAELREAGTLRRIKRFANALIDGVPVRDKDRPGRDVDLLDWLRQCRRAGLYEQGRAIFEKGGLNSVNLTDEQQIEAEDDYRICVRRGSSEETKPKRKSKKNLQDDE